MVFLKNSHRKKIKVLVILRVQLFKTDLPIFVDVNEKTYERLEMIVRKIYKVEVSDKEIIFPN